MGTELRLPKLAEAENIQERARKLLASMFEHEAKRLSAVTGISQEDALDGLFELYDAGHVRIEAYGLGWKPAFRFVTCTPDQAPQLQGSRQ